MRLAQLGRLAPKMLSTVPIRDDDRQQALTLVRARAAAVKTRTQIINTIRGLLKPYGVRISKAGRSPAFVKEARAVVPQELMVAVEPLLASLQQLNAAVADYDRTVEAALPELAPDALHLLQIDGVGPLTVLYFVALVGDPTRFPKSRSIGSYFGLCRRRDDSGDHVSELKITKAGDPYMRALLANCASHIIGPFGKPSDLRRWGTRLAGTSSRRAKNRAKIAVARKLSVLMLTLWKTGASYDPHHNSLQSREGLAA
jgi:transposase